MGERANTDLITWQAFTRYRDDEDFVRGMRLARTVAGEDAENTASSTGVLLLPPMCLAAGRVPAALDWLDEHGFSIEYAHQVRLSDDHIRRIWKYQIAEHSPLRIRVFSRLMTCGPSLLLAVVAATGDDRPTAVRLTEQKGPADPARARPEHLRSRLGAANRFNNLAHSSDGPAEAVREAAVLLDDEELARLWRRTIAGPARRTDRGRAEAESALPATTMSGGISLAHVAVALRRSLLDEMRLIRTPPLRDSLAPLRRRVSEEAAWTARRSPATPVETLAAFRARFRPRAGFDAELHPSRAGDHPRLAHLQAIFTEINAALFGHAFDFDRIEEAAELADFPLNVRDRIVFSTERLSMLLRDLPDTSPDISGTLLGRGAGAGHRHP